MVNGPSVAGGGVEGYEGLVEGEDIQVRHGGYVVMVVDGHGHGLGFGGALMHMFWALGWVCSRPPAALCLRTSHWRLTWGIKPARRRRIPRKQREVVDVLGKQAEAEDPALEIVDPSLGASSLCRRPLNASLGASRGLLAGLGREGR